VLERLALQEFHGDEGSPISLDNLVNGADVRMIQCRRSFRLALKTAECQWAFGDVIGQELESYKAAELHVFGLIYNPHRAGAKFLDDVIVRDGLPDHWRESYFRETGKSMKAECSRYFNGMLAKLGGAAGIDKNSAQILC